VEVAIVGAGKVAEQKYIPALLRHDDVSMSAYSRTPERLHQAIHLRGLDQDMEVLDHSGETHQVFRPSRHTSRWDEYDASFDKSIAAYLDSIRMGEPPRCRDWPAFSSSSSRRACASRSWTAPR
jgi:predicted dehydrogenase